MPPDTIIGMKPEGKKVHVRFTAEQMAWIQKLMKKHEVNRSTVIHMALSHWAGEEKVK